MKPKVHFIQTAYARRRARFNGTYCGVRGSASNRWSKVTCKRCLRYRKFEQGKLKIVYVEIG